MQGPFLALSHRADELPSAQNHPREGVRASEDRMEGELLLKMWRETSRLWGPHSARCRTEARPELLLLRTYCCPH